jgi:hypothetical protein
MSMEAGWVRAGILRVDSAMEQYACLTAAFGAPSQWEVVSQTWRTRDGGESIEVVSVRLPTGDVIDVEFGAIGAADDSFEGPEDDDGEEATGWLDRVMEAAVTFSEANPPHHPGTIARFPVPAAGYANALSIPMGVIAVDDRAGAGLYAPPRMVALDRTSLAAIGVGEFPDFDPEFWPPERVADWPLGTVRGKAPEQLQGMIQRFSACWRRVIEAWFGGEAGTYDYLADDIRVALEFREVLDAAAMSRYYDRMNPVFAKWLGQHQ